MKNTIETVTNEFEMREASRATRMDLYDENKNGIFSDISTVLTPGKNKVITINKRLERINGNHDRGKNLSCRIVAAEESGSVFDHAVRGKVQDVIFPLKDKIPYYGPLTDIESENMRFFITEEARELMENNMVDIHSMGEELGEILSINVNTTQTDLAEATYSTRKEIASIKRQMGSCKSKILVYKPEWGGLDRQSFLYKLATVGATPDCAKYLELDARLNKAKANIDKYSAEIMAESMESVWVPDHIDEESLRLPSFDIISERYIPETLPVLDLGATIQIDVDAIPDIPDFNLDTLDIEL